MASRSSGHFNSEMYQGTRRGRAAYGDIGFEMFSGKYEKTDIIEDPDQVNSDRRETLKDYAPESTTLFAHEETRRNTHARERLNIREAGSRWTTEPWKNEDFDIQFHDKDPRGWSTEQPWAEYRRQAEAQFRSIDFKDDGDYSTTSGAIHPNTMYKNIRSAQNWVKARLKIFETSWENQHPGGVGVYDNVSNVFKSDYEDTSVMTDGSGMSRTFEDPEIRQHHTIKLSNVVHGGSKALRDNTTTDHKVPVAGYGKLYKNRGLINHETQMRLLEDDTPWSRIEGVHTTPKNLVKLMASYVHATDYDYGNFGDGAQAPTAAQQLRMLQQESATGSKQEAFKGQKNDELTVENRNQILTKDIMALLGMVESDVKFLESYRRKNSKHADLMLANMYNLAEVVHNLPANVKLELRNELILRAGGMGLTPATGSDIRKGRDQVVVNPKIVQYMDLMVRRTEKPGANGGDENRRSGVGDPEGKLNPLLTGTALFVFRSANRTSEDIDANRRSADGTPMGARASGKKEAATHSYRHLAKYAQRMERNMKSGVGTQLVGDTAAAQARKNMNIGDTDVYDLLQQGAVDCEFGENKALTRHIGRVGSKNMRRNVDTDYYSVDHTNELGAPDKKRKNPKNANTQSR